MKLRYGADCLIYLNQSVASTPWFFETYSKRKYSELGIDVEFVQDNYSLP